MICNKLADCANAVLEPEKDNKVLICPNAKSQCIQFCDKRSKAKCEENNRKYILINDLDAKILLYQVDGGVIKNDKTVPNGIQKCDFLFILNKAADTAILVELKGIDITKSLEQLLATIAQFKDTFSKMRHVYGRSIVTASMPNLRANPKYVKLSAELKKMNGNIKIVERQYEEKIMELGKA